MKITYLLNGNPVNPVNRGDIYLEVNHDQEAIINKGVASVGINNLVFAREDVSKIRQYLKQFPGITEGIPFDILMEERGVTTTLKMYVDLMNGLESSRDGIQATVKMLQSLDWLEDKVNAFTYESMYNETGVSPFQVDGINYGSYKQFFDSRCIYIPYVISAIPNWQDAFLAIFGMTYVGTQLYDVSKNILQWSAPLPGFGLVLGIAQLVLEITFAALLIVTLIGLINQLIQCLIQPVKYHGAMLMSDLLKITAVKLGLQAQSSIWDVAPYNQIAFLPEKYNPVEAAPTAFSLMGFNVGGFATRGYTSPQPGVQHGYFNGVGGDFLSLLKRVCNGKIIIPNATNILQVERADYYPASALYQLPNIRQDWNGYNTDELIATTILSFTPDLNDKNCIDKYVGTKLQATHQQITVTNKMLVGLKGLREITIPAARGINKTSLTFIEKVVEDLQVVWHAIENIAIAVIDVIIISTYQFITVINALITVWNLVIVTLSLVTDVINVIIDAINTIPGIDIDNITVFDDGAGQLNYLSYPSLVPFVSLTDQSFTNRINALLLENDMVDVPKLLLVDTSRTEFTTQRIAYLQEQNQAVINAQNLWNKFYYIDAFVGEPNNRYTKISPALNSPSEDNPCTISLKDFLNLANNPQFNDNFGEKVVADSIQWFIEKNGKAIFDYRKKGWLADPQNIDGVKRSEEIAINLKLQITIPNGQ